MVRAKFKVDTIQRIMGNRFVPASDGGAGTYEPSEIQTIKMSPVYQNGDPDHENNKFWAATPLGGIELGCVNLDAASQFDLGEEVYVDFTPIKK